MKTSKRFDPAGSKILNRSQNQMWCDTMLVSILILLPSSEFFTIGVSVRLLPPAYGVRREGYVLTRVCLSVHGGGSGAAGGGSGPAGGGEGQSADSAGGGVRSMGGSGPASRGGGGGHYTAGGMPLAFTQGDFLV